MDVSSGVKQPLLAAQERESSVDILVTTTSQHETVSTDALEAPVLGEPQAQPKRCSRAKAIFNLSNTVIGAGMLALPKAYATLGILVGSLTLLAICYVTYVSLVVLVRVAEESGRYSYASIVRGELGKVCSAILRMAIILNCAGVIVIYLVVIADSLAGMVHVGGSPNVARLKIISFVTWLFVAPLMAPRTLRALSHASLLSLACALLFCGVTVALALAAVWQGQVPHLNWFPDLAAPGRSHLQAAAQALAAVPVIMTAFICHFNIHPIMSELKDYSHARMQQVLHRSLGFCAATYIVVPVAAYMVFGGDTHGDVISNFTPKAITELVGKPIAEVLVVAVRATNVLSLWLSMPMSMFPLRAEIFSMLKAGRQPSSLVFYSTTYGLLLLCYGLAVLIKSMWTATSLVGATSGILLSFTFPALLMLRRDQSESCWSSQKVLAWGMFSTGCVLAVVGSVSNLG